MNSVILKLIGASPPAKSEPPANNLVADSTSGADSFGTLLNGKISRKSSSLKAPRLAATKGATSSTAIEAKIEKMRKAGASSREIVATLAAQLSASVAHAVGATTPEALAQLQTAFARALAPPGDPGGGAQASSGTHALAQRFLKLQAIAANIVNGASGQQNRIAGNFLDAESAKETPAQSTLAILPVAHQLAQPLPAHPDPEPHEAHAPALRAVLVPLRSVLPTIAVAAPAAAKLVLVATPRVAEAAAATQATRLTARTMTLVPAGPTGSLFAGSTAPSGDGRTVKLGAKAAISAGGDTVLGRLLSRAALVADARDNQAPVRPTVQAAPVGAAAKAAPVGAVDDTKPEATAVQTDVPMAQKDAPSAAPTSAPATTVSAFLKSFEAALNGAASPATHEEMPDPSVAASPLALAGQPTATTQAAATAAIPTIAPFRIEQVAQPAAAAPPASAPASVDQAGIMDQVVRGAFMRTSAGSSEMRLTLVPETLGDVNVKLVVTDGNVSAHVLAQTPEVRDALVAAQPQLTKSLADAGLKLQSFTVDLSGNGFAGFSQQQTGQQQSGGFRWAHNNAVADEEAADSALEAIPSFAPPILATAGAGDFNYLA